MSQHIGGSRRRSVEAALMMTLLYGVATATASAKELQRYIGEPVMTKSTIRIEHAGQTIEIGPRHLPLYITGIEGNNLVAHVSTPRRESVKVLLDAAQVVELPDAVEFFTRLITAHPEVGAHYEFRAVARSTTAGPSTDVVDDYTTALLKGRRSANTYADRGNAYFELGELSKALGDFDEAIRQEPRVVDFQASRARALVRLGRFAEALRQYDAAIRLDPESAYLHNDCAWLLAACPDAAVRNGKRAVRLALEACELADWQDTFMLDTLAASYAESGDFETAIAMLEKGLEDFGDAGPEGMRARLELYRSGKPYREPLPKK